MIFWLSSSEEEEEDARRKGRNKGTFIITLSGIKCLSREEELLGAKRGERETHFRRRKKKKTCFWLFGFGIMDVGAGQIDWPGKWEGGGREREREGRPEKFLSSLQLHFCTVALATFLGNL